MHRFNRRQFIAGTTSLATAAILTTARVSTGFADQAVPNSSSTNAPNFKAPVGACDSHIHIFDPARFRVLPGSQYPQGSSVAEYRLIQTRLGTSRTVIVTPRPYGTDNRVTTDAVAQLGIANARGIAVLRPETSAEELRTLADGGICGVRFTVHNPQASVVQIDGIEPLANRIADLGWHVQLHLRADQIVQAAEMLKRLPTTLVLDHMGRLPQPEGIRHPAYGVIMNLIEKGRTWLKVSGPYQDTKIGPPDYEDVGAVARAFIRAAPQRLVWGSDWPHTTEKDKPNGANLLDLLAAWCGDDAVAGQILVDNPRALYRFE
jgi:D-galactarolactone isomerase